MVLAVCLKDVTKEDWPLPKCAYGLAAPDLTAVTVLTSLGGVWSAPPLRPPARSNGSRAHCCGCKCFHCPPLHIPHCQARRFQHSFLCGPRCRPFGPRPCVGPRLDEQAFERGPQCLLESRLEPLPLHLSLSSKLPNLPAVASTV